MYPREALVPSKCGAKIKIAGRSRDSKSTLRQSRNLSGVQEAGTIQTMVSCVKRLLDLQSLIDHNRGQRVPINHLVKRPSAKNDSHTARPPSRKFDADDSPYYHVAESNSNFIEGWLS